MSVPDSNDTSSPPNPEESSAIASPATPPAPAGTPSPQAVMPNPTPSSTAGAPATTTKTSWWPSKKILAAVLAPVLLAILGGLAGTIFTYWLAPQQQVRQQQGVDDAQNAADASNPPVLVENQRYQGSTGVDSTSRVLELGEVQKAVKFGNDLAPGQDPVLLPPGEHAAVGMAQRMVTSDGHPQPRVFDQMYVTLAGNHYKPVKVTRIVARVVERREPLAGTVVYAAPQGASDPESLGFDLDSSDLNARVVVTLPGEAVPTDTSKHYLDARQVTLNKDETLEFEITAFTTTCACRFVIDVSTDDGRTITVDNHGKPWEISAFSPTYARSYAIEYADTGYHVVPCSWPDGCLAV
jgi:hypothetical protein